MPALTRRLDPRAPQERWRVFYGDIQVGAIGMRSGVPIHVDQWEWSCNLHLASGRGRGGRGIAADFSTARAAFEETWHRLLPTLTESEFQEYRHDRASHAWKRAMWAAGLPLPTQTTDDRARCVCGAIISNADVPGHVDAAHGEVTE
jgi:hypothetical protein